jgi:CRISPR-associated protein Csd2
MSELYCDPNRRHDFVYFFDVTNGNPNGDPDAGNMPRVDPETMHGIVTDVCIKRKIRDYVAGVLGREIFIQSEYALNTLIGKAIKDARDADGNPVGSPLEVDLSEVPEAKTLLEGEDDELAGHLQELEDFVYDPEARLLTYGGGAKKRNEFKQALTGEAAVSKKLEDALDALAKKLVEAKKKLGGIDAKGRRIVKHDLCKTYFDIRMFGAVLTAGTNFGQVRGPVQLTFARSVDPIQPRDLSITRVAITKASDQARKTTEMGRKAIVPYGLYRLHGFFNPLLGRSSNAKGKGEQLVTEQDLADLWDALQDLFTFDRSAARGEMCVRGLYVFTHDNERGKAPSHRLFELVSVKPCGGRLPREFGGYVGGITAPAPGLLEKYPGVTLTTLPPEPAASPTPGSEA